MELTEGGLYQKSVRGAALRVWSLNDCIFVVCGLCFFCYKTVRGNEFMRCG